MKALSAIKPYLLISIIILMINSANKATAATITSKASGNWSAPATWKNGVVPLTTDDVVVDGLIVLDGNFTCRNLTINDGTGRLTVNPGTALSINVLTNNRILEIISNDAGSGSVIYNSVVGSGTVYFERYMSGMLNGIKKWHTISSPVSDCEFTSFFDNVNGNGKTTAISSDGSMFSFGKYSENINKWIYPFRSDKAGISGELSLGTGYTIALNTDNKVRIAGYPANSKVTVPIFFSTGTTPVGGFGWNSLGNPFTAAINISAFFAANSSQMDPIYSGIYVWNPDGYYDVSNMGGAGATDLQVGQGFVVRSKVGGGTINFNYTMRENATAAMFKAAIIPWPSIELKVSTKDMARTTLVTFNSAMTLGLDPFYDAGLLRSGGGMELSTRLVEDNGVDFAIQCLPDVGLDKMVIPVSLDLTTGGEVTFSAKSANLPSGYIPVLEDRKTGISTTLNSDGDNYKVVLPSNTSGYKRFYIHFNSTAKSPWPKIEIMASINDMTRTTLITFNSAMTLGLDPFYDAGLLRSGGAFELYTRLVEDNGTDFAIQCLPDVGLDKMVIPVSLDLTTGGEVTFTATSANLPAGCVPVLEDRKTGISTPLNSDGASYKVTLPSNTSGIKRFYLHLSDTKTAPTVAVTAEATVAATIPSTSSIINQNIARIKVYPIGREIHIQGVVDDQNVAMLYDITGRSVGVYPLQAADNITLYPEGINNGIYLLRIVQGNAQQFVGKMILR